MIITIHSRRSLYLNDFVIGLQTTKEVKLCEITSETTRVCFFNTGKHKQVIVNSIQDSDIQRVPELFKKLRTSHTEMIQTVASTNARLNQQPQN